jgi:hypothetical protein
MYLYSRLQFRAWKSLLAYAALAILVMFATWPYLWENPMSNFINVFKLMSDNPTNLSVLFHGQAYRAGELPPSYLPFMLATTLTEPVWILFASGLFAGYWKFSSKQAGKPYLVSLTLILLWLVTLLAYVFLRRPAMYDGFRHFLFILPPVFVFIGLALEAFFDGIDSIAGIRKSEALKVPSVLPKISTQSWLHAVLLLVLLAPGIAGIIRLHPYEYTYYNSFIGGTDGAFRNYETDYWLTCYKEAVEKLNKITSGPANLFVKREAYVAAPYADVNIAVTDLRNAVTPPQSRDFVLVNTRLNDDRSTFRDAPTLIEVKRGRATFCIVRQIP